MPVTRTSPAHQPPAELVVTPDCPEALAAGPFGLAAFSLRERLGGGKQSSVRRAVHRASGLEVALKQYTKEGLHPVHAHQCRRELRLHSSSACRHPAVLPCYAVWEDANAFYLLLELVKGGDLYQVLHERRRLSEGTACRRVLGPVLDALEDLHAAGVLHRDLKPENLLVRGDHGVVLADLGLAIDSCRERPVTRLGTLEYMPPEILRCSAKRSSACNRDLTRPCYDGTCDVWSVGVLAWEVLTGASPFHDESKDVIRDNILRKELVAPSGMGREARDFIRRCLARDPAERPTVAQLRRHPWIVARYTTPRPAPAGGSSVVSGSAADKTRGRTQPSGLASSGSTVGDRSAATQSVSSARLTR